MSRWWNPDWVINVIYVLYAETLREFITLRRYFLESISGLVMVYILFMGFFFASQGFSPQAISLTNNSDDLAHRTVGFVLWLFALNSVGHFSNAIRDESHIGVMEQIALGPSGLIVDMWGRAIGKTIIDCLMLGLVLFIIIITTRISLSFPFFSAGLVFLLTLLGLYGLGFFFGGLALIYKRLGSVTVVVRFGFLILTGAITPIENFPEWLQVISKTLPMTEGLKILRLLMVENRPFIYVLGSGDLLLLIVNSALYLSIGLISFKYLEKVARERGLLGVY
ncbi:MAG: ABC transporter permease [Thermodesulfobacteriota bacterium]|nr:ABC transporter permease [Thermodesulfobacteriota bacterium]